MTRQRYDEHSTEFGLWTRDQPELASENTPGMGFITSNLDFIWHNYLTGDWMLLEEKRHRGYIKRWQQALFDLVDRCCRGDPHYHGFHKLVFEKTNPEDGQMWLDGKLITRDELIRFLRFETL